MQPDPVRRPVASRAVRVTGSVDGNAEVIKAEDIRDFTLSEGIAEKFARRFGAAAAESNRRVADARQSAEEHRRAAADRGLRPAHSAMLFVWIVCRKRQVGGDAQARTGAHVSRSARAWRVVAVGRLDEDLRSSAPGARCSSAALRAGGGSRGAGSRGSAKRWPSSPKPSARADGRRADERHDAEALAVRGFDHLGARIGDRRATGFGEQAERTARRERRELDRAPRRSPWRC